MRRRSVLSLVLVLGHCMLFSHPALAQEPAVVEIPPPKPRSGAKQTLAITGAVLAGLGALTFFASGIVWLNASSAARRLDDECPGKVCLEGSAGADLLKKARDNEKAADILLGISLPVMTAGFVMIIYSGGSRKRTTAVHAAPSVSSRGAGTTLGVTF